MFGPPPPYCDPLGVLVLLVPVHVLTCCVCAAPPPTQIDSVQRKDRKAHAESSWARVNAEALGVDLPGDVGVEGLADLAHAAAAAGGGKRGKKRKADAVGVVEAGMNADSQVCRHGFCIGDTTSTKSSTVCVLDGVGVGGSGQQRICVSACSTSSTW